MQKSTLREHELVNQTPLFDRVGGALRPTRGARTISRAVAATALPAPNTSRWSEPEFVLDGASGGSGASLSVFQMPVS